MKKIWTVRRFGAHQDLSPKIVGSFMHESDARTVLRTSLVTFGAQVRGRTPAGDLTECTAYESLAEFAVGEMVSEKIIAELFEGKKAEEVERLIALAKLTDREQRLLGIRGYNKAVK